MPLFPIFVKLAGRPVLVVGGGTVAESKLGGLLAAGAKVTVVAPQACAAIREKAAADGIEYHQREFLPADLDGMTLVVAAVPAHIAAGVYQEAGRRGILCNSVDDPDNCDFYYPAVVQRGDLQIAVSTAGHSPALAQRLRKELELRFGPEYAGWIRSLGETRRALFSADIDPVHRKQALHELARNEPRHGQVFLVGAGPGDPELLTLKALRVLGVADVVLHDDLLTAGILELIPSSARIECVGKRHGMRQVTQEEIHHRLIDYARQGMTVVRLKGGDGAIFGRASEEMDALREADVPFTIVPGVTAASGAAAAAGISLTDRRLGSALVFLTAQRCKGNPPPNWQAIAELGGGVAIYMPGGHEADLANALIAGGLAPETSCHVISNATREDEQVIETTLGQVPQMAQLPAPSLLLVGLVPAATLENVERSRQPEARHRRQAPATGK
jgi:uroporphyrin-III C-methyltransferase/precorrin-2 dehydrogenase/sirohydrochlorin ferrochelatase